VDDDFNTRWFPAFHAADSVFRAVENRLAMGLGTTSGISQVIDPYGRMTARSDLYTREVISGPTFTVDEQTPYTRWGDWFGILISVLFGAVAVWSMVPGRGK
jgi:apolipoprotein N-acyltransferase